MSMQTSNGKSLLQWQGYTKGSAPSYVYHGAEDDQLMILCSQIKIWKPEGVDWFSIPSVKDAGCLVLREVASVEITKTYKDVISTAVVRLPRGMVIEERHKKDDVLVGNKEDDTEGNKEIAEATIGGDLMTVKSARYSKDKIPTASLAPNYDDKGLIEFNRTSTEPALLKPGDIAIGNRIEIRLGYAYSEEEYNKIKVNEGKDFGLRLVFTGFITGVSASTPLEIECENMAHILTTFSIPKNLTDKSPLTVKSFLDEDDEKGYKLLKDTGLTLTTATKKCEIDVKGAPVSKEMSVIDVIDLWRKFGVMAFMVDNEDGTSQLRVGRVYYSGKGGAGMPTDNVNYITYNGNNNSFLIAQTDWDVANDDLDMKSTDKKYLAVEAEGRDKDGNWMKLTLIKRPDIDDDGWTSDGDGQFLVSNERGYTPKKKRKRVGGTRRVVKKRTKKKNADGSTTTTTMSSNGSTSVSVKKGNTTTTTSHSATGKTTTTVTTNDGKGNSTSTVTSSGGGSSKTTKLKKNKISMKRYNVVPYISTKIGIKREELIEEAKQYWNSYVPNGIEGSLTLFGDLDVQPAQIIGIVDQRQPEKNGYYLVESVDIDFGMNGYKKKLKLPYKVASFGSPVTTII